MKAMPAKKASAESTARHDEEVGGSLRLRRESREVVNELLGQRNAIKTRDNRKSSKKPIQIEKTFDIKCEFVYTIQVRKIIATTR